MKRGDLHLDWIISFGIFIVYIVFLFTFLNPIKVNEDNKEILFDIAEQNLKNELRWNIIKVPIFVRSQNSYTDQEVCLDLFPFNWDEQDLNLTMDNNIILFNLNENDCNGIAFTEDITSQNVNLFNLVYNERQDLDIGDWVCNDFDAFTNKCNYLLSAEFTYDYGLPETLTGISLQNFNALTAENPNDIKQRWNFPSDNNINISLLDLNHDIIGSYFFDTSDIKKDNVFVSEYADKILNDDSTLSSVIVHIEVW